MSTPFNYVHACSLCDCVLSPQGKFIKINFDQSGFIAGANIDTCIQPNYSSTLYIA